MDSRQGAKLAKDAKTYSFTPPRLRASAPPRGKYCEAENCSYSGIFCTDSEFFLIQLVPTRR
ncbi:MAG: hypothetical protein RL120_13610, partial [Gammaproteobacteria bacterium]